jgi:hypothetical protein
MKKEKLFIILLVLFVSVVTFTQAEHIEGERSSPIYDGPELDYQPSIIRTEPDDYIVVLFERISLPSFYGDFYVVFSTDNGLSWTNPQPAINSSLNERHPSLVQLGEDNFALFYLVDETDAGDYRIHRATSTDCLNWTEHGSLDLGWVTPGEINPCVIIERDGSLTMVYHRLSGPSYLSRSTDQGVTWDTLKTMVSNGNAQLPRVTKRESDGLYLVTYQVGSSNLDIYSKVTTDPYDWPDTQNPLSTAINSHDSQPVVLEGGNFLVTYAQQAGSVFDVYYRTSYDGIEWSGPNRVTSDTAHFDTQPHPLLSSIPGSVILTWSHQESVEEYVDHDVWIDTDLSIPLPLWLDIDTLSASTEGTVRFTIDAGFSYAGRRYFLAGSMSGTSPGMTLPGGGVISLNRDGFTNYILAHYNNSIFVDFRGTLDGNGRATAVLNSPGSIPFPVGTILNFAFTTEAPFDFQSNPVGVVITS